MKKRKITIIFILLLIFVNICTTYSMATGIWESGKQWLETGDGDSVIDSSKYQTSVSELAGLLYGIGVAIGVIAVAVLGISFFMASSSGNNDERANIKRKAIIVAIGLAILFASVTIWQIVVNLLSSNS